MKVIFSGGGGALGGAASVFLPANALFSGHTLWVDGQSPRATDNRTNASPYDQTLPFLTIQAALDAAVPYVDWVIVRAGTYIERIIMPEGVNMIGTYNTFIEPPDSDPLPLITMNDYSYMSYFSITVPAGGQAVFYAGAGTAYVDHVDFYGLGGGDALVMDGSGLLDVVTTWLQEGEVDRLAVVNSGEAQFVEFGIYKASVTALNAMLEVASGALADVADIFCIGGAVVTNCIRCAGTLRGHTGRIQGAGVAIRVTSAAADIITGIYVQNCSVDLLIDPGSESCRFKIIGEGSTEKISAAPAFFTNPKTNIVWFDTSSVDPGMKIISKLGVGTIYGGQEVGFGSGLPSMQGLVALRNTNQAAGAWTNITADFASETPANLFSSLSAGACFYVGGITPFWAVKLGIVAPVLPSTSPIAAEYWNGAAWVSLRVMTVGEAHPHQQRGSRLFATAGAQYVRFGNDQPALLELNGINRYWVRFRLTQNIAQSPSANICRLQGSGAHIEPKGSMSFFGLGESIRPIPGVNMYGRVNLVTISAGNTNISIANNFQLSQTINSFQNNVTDGIGGLVPVSNGIDTSRELELTVLWAPASSAVGVVDFELWWVTGGDGYVFTTANPKNVIPFEATTNGQLNRGQKTVMTFNLGNTLIVPGDFFSWALVRNGGSVIDTYNGNVTLVDLQLNAHFWM